MLVASCPPFVHPIWNVFAHLRRVSCKHEVILGPAWLVGMHVRVRMVSECMRVRWNARSKNQSKKLTVVLIDVCIAVVVYCKLALIGTGG